MDLTAEGVMNQIYASNADAIANARSKDLKKIASSLKKHKHLKNCTSTDADYHIKKCLKSGFLKETKTGYVLTEKAKKTLGFMKRPLM